MNRRPAQAALFGILLAVSAARAEPETQMPEGTRHAISLEAGLDSAAAVSVGYAYRWRPALWRHDVLIYGKLGVPVAELDLADSSLEAGLRSTVVAYGNLRLQLALGFVLRNSSNRLFSANSLGLQVALLPGYQSGRWGLMADLGYEKMLATHLRHSVLYKETYYADAKNGWYGDTAGTLRLGVRGGVRIGGLHLSARMGVVASEGGEPHLLPFYGAVGAGYAF